MPQTSSWKIFYLSHLSNPSSDRQIYRTIVHKKTRRIIEAGIGDGSRALRMIEAAASFCDRSEIHYTGLDFFEDRSETDGPGLALIDAHRLFKQSGTRTKLIPGDPLRSLARAANDLGQFDMLIISAQTDADRLSKIWFFIPRLLHDQSQILLEQNNPNGKKTIQIMSFREVEQLASKAIRWKAA